MMPSHTSDVSVSHSLHHSDDVGVDDHHHGDDDDDDDDSSSWSLSSTLVLVAWMLKQYDCSSRDYYHLLE